MEEVTAYFLNGKLLKWLEQRYYEEEAEKIHNLDKDDENFAKKLCKTFGVSYGNVIVDTEKISRQNEILAELKKLTDDEEILSHYKQTALTQEDLANLLDCDETTIYLRGEKFSVPMSFENRKYIGILGKPEIKITAKTADELTAKGITFENVTLPEKLSPTPKKFILGRARIAGPFKIVYNENAFLYDGYYGMTLTNITQILQSATARLTAAGIESARLDAEVLLAHVLNCRRLYLYVDADKNLNPAQVTRFESLISQRAEKIPTAYLTGQREFMGLNFAVTPHVLIPRPDTEILVQYAVEKLSALKGDVTFADIGTGSGAI